MKPRHRNFKKNIGALKKVNDINENSFWILMHYGRSFWNFKENRVFREVLLINSAKKSYDLENWSKGKIIKVEFPEEKTFSLPLGSVFASDGKFIKIPDQKDKGLYTIRNVTVSKNTNYFKNGYFGQLKQSNYPIYNDYVGGVYAGCPYYKVFENYFGIKRIIIPAHVIRSYFYNLSSLSIHHIVWGSLFKGIEDPIKVDSNWILPYNSSIIAEREARLLGKYVFTNDKIGINTLRESHNAFKTNLLKDQKHEGNGRYYLDGRVPFKFEIKLNVLGHYIKKDDNEQCFLVHQIIGAEPKDKEIHSFFTNDSFKLWDLNDKRSKRNDGNITTNVKGVSNIESLDNLPIKDGETNTSISPQEIPVSIGNIFLQTPSISKLDKDSQEQNYTVNKYLEKEYNSLGTNYGNTNSDSETRRFNELSLDSLNNYFKILPFVIEILEKDGIICEYLKLKDHEGIYSFPPIQTELARVFLILKISFKDRHYCLVDSGYGKSIGFFSYVDQSIEFESYDDETVKYVLIHMIRSKRLNWSKVGNDLYLSKKLNIKLYKSMKHVVFYEKDKINFKKSAESLAERIKERVLL